MADREDGLDISILAQRLTMAREAVGLTQTEVAARAGINLGNYNELERAQRSGLRADTLVRLSRVLGVSLDYLVGLTDDPRPAPNPAASAQRRPRRRGGGRVRYGPGTVSRGPQLSAGPGAVDPSATGRRSRAGAVGALCHHEGMLDLPGLGRVPVYQLNTGERVCDGETLERLVGLNETEEDVN